MRITPRQKENRHSKPAGQSLHGDIRMDRGSQPPDSTDILRRSYLLSEQSPASSHSAPIKALDNNTPKSPLRQGFGRIFFIFCVGPGVGAGTHIFFPPTRSAETGENVGAACGRPIPAEACLHYNKGAGRPYFMTFLSTNPITL